ncbi:hypothetical protein Tco_0932303 [Tanacetum coccineum]
MESSDQFICFFCGSLSDEYGCPCSASELCGNDAHYGYDCPSQVPFVYNQDPCLNQSLDNFPQTSPSFPQQDPCCEDYGSPHATFECQPMNQNFYEPNFCYNSNSSGFDQFQPPQYPVIHQPRQEMSTEMLLVKEKLIKAIRTCLKNNNQPPEEKSIAVLLAEESILTVMQTLEEKQIDTETKICTPYWKCPIFDADDDEEYTIQVREYYKNSPVAITPDLPIMDSLIIEDEHLDTIPETESDEENESNFNNDSKIFSNPLFDSNVDYTSSDDESSSEEDVPIENFKIYSNPLLEFDEEIFSSEINPIYNEVLEDLDSIPPGNENDHFNAESDLIESLLNKDTMITSLKIDFLLEEFTGELALIKPIPLGIAETNFDPKEDIRLIKNGSTTIHTDISLPEYESFDDESDSASEIFNDDLAHIISPSEYKYVYANDESNSGDLTTDMVEDISGDSTKKLQMSHRGFKALKISHNFFNKSSMMIYGGDMPILDVSITQVMKTLVLVVLSNAHSIFIPLHVYFGNPVTDIDKKTKTKLDWTKPSTLLERAQDYESDGFVCVGYGTWFLSQKGGGGGRGVKEKQHNSANNPAKDIVVVSSPVVDEPMVAARNTKHVNVGQTPISSTIDPNSGNRTDVAVPLESIRAISDRFVNTAYGFFLGKRVKLHGVPVTKFSGDGLSAIATILGTSLMLDSYTSDMCMQSWGRSIYVLASKY